MNAAAREEVRRRWGWERDSQWHFLKVWIRFFFDSLKVFPREESKIICLWTLEFFFFKSGKSLV